jgi:HTH domain
MEHDSLFLTIRRLFTADDTQLDMESVLLLIRLLVQRADEKPTFLSHGTLARQLRCSESTVASRMQKLKQLGILAIKSGKRSNSPNDVTVLLNKLPQGDLKPVTVSDAARKVAADYKTVLLKYQPKRHFQAGTLQRWEYTMQWLIDKKCKGSSALLRDVINVALTHADYTKAALRGPEQIRKRWRSLFVEYTARQIQGGKVVNA